MAGIGTLTVANSRINTIVVIAASLVVDPVDVQWNCSLVVEADSECRGPDVGPDLIGKRAYGRR